MESYISFGWTKIVLALLKQNTSLGKDTEEENKAM